MKFELTGEQNSSNAGFTKFIYWLRTCSKSLPLSIMSRGTEKERKTWNCALYKL